MNLLEKNYADLGYMDALASGDSFLHRIEPRAKVIVTMAYIVTVVSYAKYTTVSFLPFVAYPLILIMAGGLPLGYFFRKVLLLSPFALIVGVFNTLIDRSIVYHIGAISVTGGWISFLSIFLRFMLTASAALLLVGLTGFNAVCRALVRLGVPKPFVTQLSFIYRYIFVLSDEAQRMERARSLRSLHTGAMKYRTFTSLAGHLLLRTLDRAERIYCAMSCRGFDGTFRVVGHERMSRKDFLFVVVWCCVFVVFRMYDFPVLLGELVMRFTR